MKGWMPCPCLWPDPVQLFLKTCQTYVIQLYLYTSLLFLAELFCLSLPHMEFSPLLFLLSKQCIFIMKELEQQINNDSNHHPFGIVTEHQTCHYSRMPKASCQMVNNLSRRAMSAARHCRKAWTGESSRFGLGLGAQLPALLAVQKSLHRLIGTIRTSIGPQNWKLQD